MTNYQLWLGTYTGGEDRDGIYRGGAFGGRLNNRAFAGQEGVPPLDAPRQRVLPYYGKGGFPLCLGVLRRVPCGV